MPFGPYLSIAALILMMAWPWVWPGGVEILLRHHFHDILVRVGPGRLTIEDEVGVDVDPGLGP